MANNGFGDGFDDMFGGSSNGGTDGFSDFSDFGDSSFGQPVNSSGSTSGFDDDFGSGFGDSDTDAFNNASSGNQGNAGFTDNNTVQNQNNQNSQFSGQFDINGDAPDEAKQTKKTAIMIVGVGAVLVILALAIFGIINKKGKETQEPDYSQVTIVEQPEQQNQQQVQNRTPDEIMQSGSYVEPNTSTAGLNNNTSQSTVASSNDDWVDITDDEDIEFNDSYTDMIFTITGVRHKAKLTDNSLMVITTLQGSISGLSGSYELDVPYYKGKLLSIGNEFKVKVMLGQYNGKVVVGDIKY